MAFQPVEWILAIFYGPSAHRAAYGRLAGTKYTKDYIQLSRTETFIEELKEIFGLPEVGGVDLTYKWPGGDARGELVAISADRPHLKWETRVGAPAPWKMVTHPANGSIETIPGNPALEDADLADAEFDRIATSGAGQPYLLAIKLRGEPGVLHLRAYLDGGSEYYAWASLAAAPARVRQLALKTTRNRALASTILESNGTLPSDEVKKAIESIATVGVVPGAAMFDQSLKRSVLRYLQEPAKGLFFDPLKNHDAWCEADEASTLSDEISRELVELLVAMKGAQLQDDWMAEAAPVDEKEVQKFQESSAKLNYRVDDATATVKTRGSAQRVFSSTVKNNYGYRCAVTGITTKVFLVASHIVPWSDDQDIRLDPANGICLSLLVDRAFETGYLEIQDDYTVTLNLDRIGGDEVLLNYLLPFNGRKLALPSSHLPRTDFIARRRNSFLEG